MRFETLPQNASSILILPWWPIGSAIIGDVRTRHSLGQAGGGSVRGWTPAQRTERMCQKKCVKKKHSGISVTQHLFLLLSFPLDVSLSSHPVFLASPSGIFVGVPLLLSSLSLHACFSCHWHLFLLASVFWHTFAFISLFAFPLLTHFPYHFFLFIGFP